MAINATQQQFIDSVFGVRDLADPSKFGQFDASAISTATVRVLAFPNASGTIALEGWVDDNFLALDGEGTDVTNGTFNLTTTGLGTFGSLQVNGVATITGIGDGGRTNYDLIVGSVNYGMVRFGNAVLGRTSFKAGNIDLDGAILFQNIGGPVTGEVEFCFAISTGSSTRFALAKAGVGNASYHSRSILIAGPAPANTDYVKVSYWQTNNNIFHNLACDTDASGADFGVQGSIECEVAIFTDSIIESTPGAGVTIEGVLLKDNNITQTGDIIPIDSTKELGGVNVWAALNIDGTIGVPFVNHTLDINVGNSFDFLQIGTDVVLNFDGSGANTGTLTYESDNDLFNFNANINIVGDLDVENIVCDTITAGEYFGLSDLHLREFGVTFGKDDSAKIFIDIFAPFGDAWTFRTDGVNVEQLVLKSNRLVLDAGGGLVGDYELRANDNQFKFQFNSRPWLTSSFANRVIQFGGDIFVEQTALPVEFLDKNSAVNYIAKIDGFNGTVELRGNITLDPTDGGNWAGAEVLIGDSTNHTAFEADGTIEFNGTATVFKDINIGAATLSGPIGLQPDIVNYLDENGADTGIATLGLDVGEGFSGQFEMQHDYKEGSDIVFHIHWQGIAAPTGTDKVQFQLSYTVGKNGETLDVPTVITIETDFDTQYEFIRSDFVTITGTTFNIEDQFIFTVERIAASADEYGGDALTATVGIHYEVDTVGSRQILIK